MSYLWVTIGSALGGLLRYAISRLTMPISGGVPFGTILINILGSFVIGYFGTLTLHNGKYPVSDNVRLFVMVGICGSWGKALTNIVLSVVLCLAAVAAGHRLAQHSSADTAIAETAEEEYTG
jgi:CrcB protein